VVMARAGVGKTACLVQIALDDLMRERKVLHITLEHTIDHVQSWYDALFDDLAARTNLAEREQVPLQTVLDRAIENYRRKRFLASVNATYEALRSNPQDSSTELNEREEWSRTAGDGDDE